MIKLRASPRKGEKRTRATPSPRSSLDPVDEQKPKTNKKASSTEYPELVTLKPPRPVAKKPKLAKSIKNKVVEPEGDSSPATVEEEEREDPVSTDDKQEDSQDDSEKKDLSSSSLEVSSQSLCESAGQDLLNKLNKSKAGSSSSKKVANKRRQQVDYSKKVCDNCGTQALINKAKKCQNCGKFFHSHWASRCRIPPCPRCHYSRKSNGSKHLPSNCERCKYPLEDAAATPEGTAPPDGIEDIKKEEEEEKETEREDEVDTAKYDTDTQAVGYGYGTFEDNNGEQQKTQSQSPTKATPTETKPSKKKVKKAKAHHHPTTTAAATATETADEVTKKLIKRKILGEEDHAPEGSAPSKRPNLELPESNPPSEEQVLSLKRQFPLSLQPGLGDAGISCAVSSPLLEYAQKISARVTIPPEVPQPKKCLKKAAKKPSVGGTSRSAKDKDGPSNSPAPLPVEQQQQDLPHPPPLNPDPPSATPTHYAAELDPSMNIPVDSSTPSDPPIKAYQPYAKSTLFFPHYSSISPFTQNHRHVQSSSIVQEALSMIPPIVPSLYPVPSLLATPPKEEGGDVSRKAVIVEPEPRKQEDVPPPTLPRGGDAPTSQQGGAEPTDKRETWNAQASHGKSNTEKPAVPRPSNTNNTTNVPQSDKKDGNSREGKASTNPQEHSTVRKQVPENAESDVPSGNGGVGEGGEGSKSSKKKKKKKKKNKNKDKKGERGEKGERDREKKCKNRHGKDESSERKSKHKKSKKEKRAKQDGTAVTESDTHTEDDDTNDVTDDITNDGTYAPIRGELLD